MAAPKTLPWLGRCTLLLETASTAYTRHLDTGQSALLPAVIRFLSTAAPESLAPAVTQTPPEATGSAQPQANTTQSLLQQKDEQATGLHDASVSPGYVWPPASSPQQSNVNNARQAFHTTNLSSQTYTWPPPPPYAPRNTTPAVETLNQGQAAQDEQQSEQPIQPSEPSLLMRILPQSLVPYAQLMRLDKPIGTWLLVWPSYWSIALAAPPGELPDLQLLALFGAGAVGMAFHGQQPFADLCALVLPLLVFVLKLRRARLLTLPKGTIEQHVKLLRGAGCTINDLWDRELDKRVERTKSRPLASGALQPRHAVGLLAVQLLLGLLILLQLNDFSKVLGASSLLLVGTYPLMKRITNWPQAYLGLTINWGALLGWAAVYGDLYLPAVIPLYLAGVNWSLVYDTIYAHQDKRDDLKAGMKSTALYFGANTRKWLTGFSFLQLACMFSAGAAINAGLPYQLGVLATFAHLHWQIRTVNLNSNQDCMNKFVSNKWCGALLFSGIVADKLLGQPGPQELLELLLDLRGMVGI